MNKFTANPTRTKKVTDTFPRFAECINCGRKDWTNQMNYSFDGTRNDTLSQNVGGGYTYINRIHFWHRKDGACLDKEAK
jgi:hypothetical protein